MLLFFFALASLPVKADCLSQAPKTSAFEFVEPLMAQKIPASAKFRQFSQACGNMDPSFNETLKEARALRRKQNAAARKVESERDAYLANILATFKMGDLGIEKEYSKELDKLKKIADPLERQRGIYSLAQRYQGKHSLEQRAAMPTPTGTLLRARTTGSGGACTDFSMLLGWSLVQAQNGPDGKPQFKAELAGLPNHELVKVTLLGDAKKKSYWLDPTNSDEFSPSPMFDVDSKDASLASQLEQCKAIGTCIYEDMQKSAGASPRPSSGATR